LNTAGKLIVSDAGPLIQLAISDYLYVLPKLYDIVIPEQVFEETQYYKDLPDAMEIAKATKSWLAVKQVKNKSEVKRLTKNQKLGKGEAEAIILCKELRALAVLTSDRYAAIKAKEYGMRTMNMADIIRQFYNAKALTASQVIELIDKLLSQNILDTQYIRDLKEEAKGWR